MFFCWEFVYLLLFWGFLGTFLNDYCIVVLKVFLRVFSFVGFCVVLFFVLVHF